MSDDPIGALMAQLVKKLADISASQDDFGQRIAALEARMVMLRGSMGAHWGDSEPGVITQAEPNAPR